MSLGVIAANRSRVDPALWINFEHLVTRFKTWEAANGPRAPRQAAPHADVAADAPA